MHATLANEEIAALQQKIYSLTARNCSLECSDKRDQEVAVQLAAQTAECDRLRAELGIRNEENEGLNSRITLANLKEIALEQAQTKIKKLSALIEAKD